MASRREVEGIRYGEDNPIENAPEMTDEEKYLLAKKMKALDKLLEDEGHAKYKIEVFFSRKRTLNGLSAGILTLWESGTKFHGGGDSKVYWCPGKDLGKNDCAAVIPDAFNEYGFLLCAACKELWKGHQVRGELLGKWTIQQWAETIHFFYRKLEHNADVYLKYPLADLREASRQEQEKQMHGDVLGAVRRGRQVYIYPLKNIIKDTSAGADLLGRFKAFLSA
jgi:hypothetical protein